MIVPVGWNVTSSNGPFEETGRVKKKTARNYLKKKKKRIKKVN